MRDKRVLPSERGKDGCSDCGRRHIHTDSCKVLKLREDMRSKAWANRDRRTESAL